MALKRAKADFSPEGILRKIREGKELFESINSLKSNLTTNIEDYVVEITMLMQLVYWHYFPVLIL